MMLENLRNRPAAKWIGLLAVLIVANVGYYFYSSWGLVTIDARAGLPLKQIISKIEWQAWVKVYTNLPLDTKVTMYVDHVPLADAMETLAANVDVPDDGTRPPRDGGAGGNGPATNNAPGQGGAPPVGLAQGGPGPGAGGPASGGPPGGGRGGGGLGRRAEWNLAFFVGPTAADVKQEIAQFQAGDPAIDAKVFAYNTQLQTIASDTVVSTPDPHAQAWPGYKPAPAPDPALAANAPADPPAPPLPIAQRYLEAFAASANIWIMAANSWTPDVANPPAPDSSIIRAVKNFVSGSHGAITQALVLRAGRGGPRGGTRNDFSDDAWVDRMRNAINGLPADEKPDALVQLNQEVAFRKEVAVLPPEQRRQRFMAHFMERMLYADHSRLSPEKRAKMYQRMIANRQAAKAAK